MSPQIDLLCKGSLNEGLGHVSRSASVARELARLGAAVRIVLIGDEPAARTLEDFALDFTLVESEKTGVAMVTAQDAVALDMTFLEDRLFDHLRRGRLCVSLSPVFNRQADVDLSFSRVQHDPFLPADGRTPKHHMGLSYAVISPFCTTLESGQFERNLQQPTLSIGVAMGGSDAPNKTRLILQWLQTVDAPLLVWVMLGEGYAHSFEALVETTRKDRRHEIVLAKTSRSMWSLLHRCSLLVLAGGITTYEAAYVGLPSINVLENAGDSFLVQELVDAGVALSLVPDEDRSQDFQSTLRQLVEDRASLREMHQRTAGLIDGKGQERIARQIMERLASC